jgi:ubiquitin C-terminal hydrolase
MKILNKTKVNTITTQLTNEYIFHTCLQLTNNSSCQTSKDAHEYMMDLRQCLLDELQPASQPSDDLENNITYDENLHSSMVTFWDLFKGIFTQKITCTQCNTFSTTEIPFMELMLNFPEEHHTSSLGCTLEQLINHRYGQREINNYQCNDCTRKTAACQCTFISQFPKILYIHLDCKKPDG